MYNITIDIDCESIDFKPIENFGGIIVGNNHHIRNLHIVSSSYAGLFASTLSNSVIKDLFISSSYFEGITAGAFAG